ncbi:TAXI family TRAP transporter solute-binding subunit [Candidatus Marinarcus aquaticus]|uniref:C4-dicarboxylate ABC transporter substrate-binding protein n=1 Tax=Candidatus Marinarcus aquaticus TaxID=2044504 RepID=A0A4Q0XQ29_9BACT|nr:TAXI family TRAP transporter solute-binding subunit [Candidatus Marinarcus aquaticus]RXJ57624.1 hypothetical protein CRV04_07375 [Candidatus Marinarcus aquaticus]
MKSFFKIYLPIITVIFLAFYITSQFIEPAPKKEITIAAGSKDGTYYQTALAYKKLLEKEKVKVTLLETKGSIDNIQLIQQGKADIGFIQNGVLKPAQLNSVESLASIYYEPLWIFYKNEGFEIEYVIQLISKKIAVGGLGSGTRDLALTILNDNGINNENSSLLELNSTLAKQQLLEGKIDAMLVVISPKSALVQSLLEDPNINVLSIKRARAYSRKYTFLTPLTLYEGTMDLYKNLPSDDTSLLATTANLIVRKEMPEELVRLFLKKVKQTHQEKTLFAQEGEFPNLLNMQAPINKEAEKYMKNGDSWLESIFPYWIASNIDRLKILLIPLLTLMFPLFKGIMPLYTWTMRSKIYKWYDDLNDIDKALPSYNQEQLHEKLITLQNLQEEISKQTKVPLAFMGEYYNLLLHLEMITNKIKARL